MYKNDPQIHITPTSYASENSSILRRFVRKASLMYLPESRKNQVSLLANQNYFCASFVCQVCKVVQVRVRAAQCHTSPKLPKLPWKMSKLSSGYHFKLSCVCDQCAFRRCISSVRWRWKMNKKWSWHLRCRSTGIGTIKSSQPVGPSRLTDIGFVINEHPGGSRIQFWRLQCSCHFQLYASYVTEKMTDPNTGKIHLRENAR